MLAYFQLILSEFCRLCRLGLMWCDRHEDMRLSTSRQDQLARDKSRVPIVSLRCNGWEKLRLGSCTCELPGVTKHFTPSKTYCRRKNACKDRICKVYRPVLVFACINSVLNNEQRRVLTTLPSKTSEFVCVVSRDWGCSDFLWNGN
jgi:hypothetical protein